MGQRTSVSSKSLCKNMERSNAVVHREGIQIQLVRIALFRKEYIYASQHRHYRAAGLKEVGEGK